MSLQWVYPPYLFWVLLHLLSPTTISSSHPILQDVQIRQSVCVLRFPFFPSRVVFFRFSHANSRESRAGNFRSSKRRLQSYRDPTRIAQIPKTRTNGQIASRPQSESQGLGRFSRGVVGRDSLEKYSEEEREDRKVAVIVITYLQIRISSASH